MSQNPLKKKSRSHPWLIHCHKSWTRLLVPDWTAGSDAVQTRSPAEPELRLDISFHTTLQYHNFHTDRHSNMARTVSTHNVRCLGRNRRSPPCCLFVLILQVQHLLALVRCIFHLADHKSTQTHFHVLRNFMFHFRLKTWWPVTEFSNPIKYLRLWQLSWKGQMHFFLKEGIDLQGKKGHTHL